MQRTIAFLAVLLFATPAVLRADPTDDYVKARMNEFHLPGLSLAVVKDGKIVKAAGYGFANVERRTPVTPETVFKICSVSKQFIATGIMLLAEAGRLSVDDRASRYLSGTPPAWQPITIRQLLTHTAGLVRESPVFDPSKAQADAEVVAGAYREPLRFVPGSKWEYSNVGFLDDGVSIVVLANGNDVDLADIVFGMARFHLPLTTAAGVGRQDCLLPHCGLRAISFRH